MKPRILSLETTRRLLLIVLLPALIVLAQFAAETSSAQKPDEPRANRQRLINPLTDPNLPAHVDARTEALGRTQQAEPSPARKKAVLSLMNRLGGPDNLRVIYNGLTQTPSRLYNPQGYLTEPSSAAPEAIARGFLTQWNGLFGFSGDDLNNLKLRSRAVTQEGTTIMLFQQLVNGVPIYQGEVLVNVSRGGRIINVGGMSYPQLTVINGEGIAPAQAVANAAQAMKVEYTPQPEGVARILFTHGNLKPEFIEGERFGRNGGISDDIAVQKVIFPLGAEGRLAYKFVLTTPQYYGIMWQHIVDAETGEILQRLSLTAFQNEPGGGVGNNRRGTFRPDVQNLVESYYHPGGASGKVFDTYPATLSGDAGAGRATRTGSPGSYVFSKPTYQSEAADTNYFRFSMINARNENTLFFNGTGTQTFTEAQFPGVLGQIIRGFPDATFPSSSSPFGWFYLPTGPNGSEITTPDPNRATTRVSGYTMSSEAQARNQAVNSPSGSGAQPYAGDPTSLGANVTLADGRVLNSVIQSRYTEGNNVSVSDDRENDDSSTRGIKGYSANRQFIDGRFDYFSSYELGGTNASGGGTGGGTVVYPATANADVYPGTVSLFYFNNVEHDYLYSIGFTEALWNFQFDNFGKGGAGGDGIMAEVQDGSGTDNANMGTPDDGASPRMQMYLFTDGGFRRSDGDFDWDVIAHEHYHGVSNRSAGKGLTSCLGTPLVGESGGMGEGWSDFIASSLSDDDNEGEHVTGDQDKGIRRVPYTNYRYSYGAINDVTLNVRKNSNTDIIGPDGNPGGIPYEVHDIGEVWAAVLWDMRELMIVKQKVGASYPGIFFDGTRRLGNGTTYYIGARAVQSVDANHPINYRQSFATDDGTTTPFPSSVGPKLNAGDLVRPGAVATEEASGLYPRRSGPLATAVSIGARLADKITLRGLQLAPCNPSFVDMRDSMIAADREITGGENVALIWRAFASHGVGVNATSSNSGTGGPGAVAEDFTVPATVTTCEANGPIAAPAFTVANTAANTVTVTITAAAGASDYVIGRSTSPNGPFTTVATAAGTTYQDTDGISIGKTYYYQVHARRNSECVGLGDIHSVTITIGSAPVLSPVFFGLDSADDDHTGNSLTLSWSPATSANPSATIVYDVYRVQNVALDNDLTAPTFVPSASNRIAQGVTGTSYINTGLTTGQQYYYIVRARDTNNGQTDTGNVGNTKAVVNAPTTAAAVSTPFALEDFSQTAANNRFTPALTESATPDNSTALFQRVPDAVLGLVNSAAMYAPDFDPGNANQGGPSNFATLIGPITLTRGSVLEFDHRYTTEAAFDGGNLEVVLGTPSANPADATPFPNNTTTFELNDYLIQNGYNGALTGTLEAGAILSPLQGRRSFTGTSALAHVRAALGDFAPGGVRNPNSLPVYVRFHMSSDVATNAGNGSGWYIDNLVVNNFAPTATITISGTITNGGNPLPGVNVALSGTSTSSTTTDSNGQYTLTGVSGGNYLVTPTLNGYNFEPVSRNYPNVAANVTDADFTANPTGTNPRTLTVVSTFATPTQPVTVPVVLNSQGNEASLTFSLAYDTAILSNPVVVCGSDAGAGCSLTVNTNTAGQIGVSVDPESGTFATGAREVIRVTFNTAATTAPNTPVNFSDTPALRETSDAGANPLPTAYVGGYVIFAQGIEADVAPRPNGNGSVSATDVSQIRRFAVGLDTFDTLNNEYQRADCAPFATLGNGSVAATDVTQARRYQLGSDPSQPAGGPNSSSSFAPLMKTPYELATQNMAAIARVVRVISVNTSPGGTVTVTLQADANGDENNYGFSLNYNTAILSDPVVTIGAGATGGNVLSNTTTMPGKIGFSVDFGGATMPSGLGRQLVTVRFNVAANAPSGQTPLTFGDSPALRETSDPGAQALPTSYQDGFVNIASGPTAASVSLSGRVTSQAGQGAPNAIVTLTDSNGANRAVRTNGFGNYRFDAVGSGQTYVLSVSHKQYSFEPRALTVMEEMTEVNFSPSQ